MSERDAAGKWDKMKSRPPLTIVPDGAVIEDTEIPPAGGVPPRDPVVVMRTSFVYRVVDAAPVFLVGAATGGLITLWWVAQVFPEVLAK